MSGVNDGSTEADEFALRYAAVVAASDQLVEAMKPTFNLVGDLYRLAKAAGIPESGCEFIVNRYIRFFNIGDNAS